MSNNYFHQIIFPPLPKPPHTEQRFDINNRPIRTYNPVSAYQPIKPVEPVKPTDHFDFWFIEVTDSRTEERWSQLIAACPVCDTSFIVRNKVKSEEIMRHALRIQGPFYMEYVKNHCPKCYPGNPVPRDDEQ